MRREFIDLAKGKTAPIAKETLQRIAALYEVEDELRGKPPDLRRTGRQQRSRPLVEDLFAWLSAQLARLPGGSPTAQAIRYALNHRDGLVRFFEDGRIELDFASHYFPGVLEAMRTRWISPQFVATNRIDSGGLYDEIRFIGTCCGWLTMRCRTATASTSPR